MALISAVHTGGCHGEQIIAGPTSECHGAGIARAAHWPRAGAGTASESADIACGGFRSALSPLSDADASVTANLPVDSPFGSGLRPMTIGLQPGGDDRS